jgi:hypothetical protein
LCSEAARTLGLVHGGKDKEEEMKKENGDLNICRRRISRARPISGSPFFFGLFIPHFRERMFASTGKTTAGQRACCF